MAVALGATDVMVERSRASRPTRHGFGTNALSSATPSRARGEDP
jgi:hypothetical protein